MTVFKGWFYAIRIQITHREKTVSFCLTGKLQFFVAIAQFIILSNRGLIL
ncbi:hypothetical protein K788_0007639 [Paraburkholderia caribensis MBA4]|uniref:Uncharacterized protein n=1 Tax=Paraburkholderia caribensis MBA4 TaxID=1323664 RepID=A0A0P0RH47_9BURK|nr:hypothetical protein K788_0007639 [Paraburkholderia caribensis MBA4]